MLFFVLFCYSLLYTRILEMMTLSFWSSCLFCKGCDCRWIPPGPFYVGWGMGARTSYVLGTYCTGWTTSPVCGFIVNSLLALPVSLEIFTNSPGHMTLLTVMILTFFISVFSEKGTWETMVIVLAYLKMWVSLRYHWSCVSERSWIIAVLPPRQ